MGRIEDQTGDLAAANSKKNILGFRSPFFVAQPVFASSSRSSIGDQAPKSEKERGAFMIMAPAPQDNKLTSTEPPSAETDKGNAIKPNKAKAETTAAPADDFMVCKA